MTRLDALQRWAVQQPPLRVFTIVVRALLAFAFIPSGLVKILDQPFTQVPVTDPVGAFFAGFFTAHEYYRFVGVAQWIAAALLLFPRTATLGAAVYLPIIVNIAAITLAIGPSFGLTRVITTAMVLVNLYLLAWDWDRWRHLASSGADRARHGSTWTAVLLLGAAGLAFLGVTSAHLALMRDGSYVWSVITLLVAVSLGATGLRRAFHDAGAGAR